MIEGSLVRLRALERGDVPAMVKWLNDDEVTQFLKTEGPVSIEMEDRWFLDLQKSQDKVFAIDAKDGRFIGTVSVHGLDWTNRRAEMGIMIGEKDLWGKGYGTDAIITLLRYIFSELDINRIGLIVDKGNERGVRCYEKCGFKKEGELRQFRFKRGRYIDNIQMSILREDWVRMHSR